METNLVLEALKFMALGMGIVFTFLIVMVYALKIQAKIINKYFPQKQQEAVKPRMASTTKETAKIAAIVAAVQHHNNQKG